MTNTLGWTRRCVIPATALGAMMALISVSAPATAAECPTDDKAVKAGTIEGWGKSVGWIVGARWGEGTLTLDDGSTHKFTFNGAKLLDTGVARVDFKGSVYNLDSLQDFPGDYAAVGSGVTIGAGVTGGAVLKNENCVFIEVSVESEGLRLSAPAPGGVLVKLEE